MARVQGINDWRLTLAPRMCDSLAPHHPRAYKMRSYLPPDLDNQSHPSPACQAQTWLPDGAAIYSSISLGECALPITSPVRSSIQASSSLYPQLNGRFLIWCIVGNDRLQPMRMLLVFKRRLSTTPKAGQRSPLYSTYSVFFCRGHHCIVRHICKILLQTVRVGVGCYRR